MEEGIVKPAGQESPAGADAASVGKPEAVLSGPLGRKLRVLHVIAPGRGREARHLRLLLKHLDRRRFECEVAVSSPEFPEFPEELRGLARRVHVLELSGTLLTHEYPAAVGALVACLRGGRFDVVHLHGRRAALPGRPAARIAAVHGVVSTPHGFSFQYLHSARSRRLHARIERTLNRLVDVMVCASETEAESARRMRLIEPGRIRVIPDAVDLDALPKRVARRALKERLKLSGTATIVAMTGRLDPPRDPGMFLRAARHVLKAKPRTCFVLVGEGELLDFCRELARQLGIADKVLCTGYRSDAAEIAAAASVVVLSAREGEPSLGLLESMAMGKPVVASDVGGFREVITHGKTGVLFPAGDERILAGAILKLLGDGALARRLGAGARQYVRMTRDINAWARAIEDTYRLTLRDSSRKRRRPMTAPWLRLRSWWTC
jgi:glycosyltransferase involved in cell wall biosynthesis